MFFEFAFGMLVGLLYIHRQPPAIVARMALLLGAILILVTGIFFRDSTISRSLIFGLPFALIVFGCVNLRQLKKSFLTILGDASYSIYLVQVFTISAFYKLAQITQISLHADILALLCLIFSTISGLVLYYGFETRASAIIKKYI